MRKAATKRRPPALDQLRMQVDGIVGRSAAASGSVLTEERVTADGEIIEVAVPATPALSQPEDREPFGQWLLAQRDRGNWIDGLVDAARRDPAFPKRGDPDQVRDHLQARGADADAFEQVDDAERCWLSM